MMVLMVGLFGCKGVTIDTFLGERDESEIDGLEVVNAFKCDAYNNTCDVITGIDFDQDGTLSSDTLEVDVYWRGDLISIKYKDGGFSYEDWSKSLQYQYVSGDNFIAVTSLPSYVVNYFYEGEPEFNKIINEVGYEQMTIKIRGVISAPKA